MYCMKLAIYGSRGDQLALNSIYEAVADRYRLPQLETLRTSVDAHVLWPEGDYQAYYVDDLKEQQSKLLFQIRTRTHRESRDFTDIFFSVENEEPHPLLNITFQFAARGDRGMSSFVLGLLKEYQKQQGLELEFLFEGFYERAYFRTFKDNSIRSQKLAEFQWIEQLHRYLHVKERLEDVQEVQRAKTHL